MTQHIAATDDRNRNRCYRCLLERHEVLPAGYEDLGAFGRCGACDELMECYDPAVLRRYAAAGVSSYEVRIGLPILRRPEIGAMVSLADIDALIRERAGHESD